MGNEFSLQGYNECLITYILAASSPTYSIDAETYYKGWTRNGTYLQIKKIRFPLYVKHNYAEEYGGLILGALFLHRSRSDEVSDKLIKNYFDLNKNQVLIDYKYCVENPKNGKVMDQIIGD
jgi:hypothetical protein